MFTKCQIHKAFSYNRLSDFRESLLLELSLFVTNTLDPGGEAWRRHVQQDVGTIHPVDMRDHGVKSMGGHILKPEMLLDLFMKKFHGPAQPVSHDNLACRGPQIIAGKILAATYNVPRKLDH
jgi:hypothetical protein